MATDRTKGSGRYEELYLKQGEDAPWAIDKPSSELVELVTEIPKGNALDIGCGVGQESIFLAKNGFSVSGIDVAPTAIRIAKKKAREARAKVKFYVGDALSLRFKDDEFDFVNDRGLFHTLNPDDRRKFVLEIERVLRKGGLYFMQCFSDKEPDTGKGAYHLSEDEIRGNFESRFSIVSIKPILMYARDKSSRQGYCCRMLKK